MRRAWGWRVWSAPDKSSHIELCVDADQYVARTYAGSDQQSEIWTRLDAVDERATDIEVSFYLSGVPEEKVGQLGEAMLRLYTRLWDEDESMMQERQRRLDQRPGREQEKIIGKTLNWRLTYPLRLSLTGSSTSSDLTSLGGSDR